MVHSPQGDATLQVQHGTQYCMCILQPRTNLYKVYGIGDPTVNLVRHKPTIQDFKLLMYTVNDTGALLYQEHCLLVQVSSKATFIVPCVPNNKSCC